MSPQHRPIQDRAKEHLVLIVNAEVGEIDMVNDPDYDPEEDDDFLEKNPLYYVSKEYAEFCLENGEGYLPRDVAQDIVDQS
ncbi:17235_t:CDS:2 [Gigaspora margarita]|uniref:17235_t:CDS:1 n=1 Tax=Gigaspora margarita TaxID=4874 RepID=A0ABN7VHA5_GIGMA|nr:17235_t:CDS:2 [Gigaspora margarita]